GGSRGATTTGTGGTFVPATGSGGTGLTGFTPGAGGSGGGEGGHAPEGDSCAGILANAPGSPNGVYWLSGGGIGGGGGAPVEPYPVYCDMTGDDGGGWTLVLKIDGTQTTFAYDGGHWTDRGVINPTHVLPAPDVDAKLASYFLVPVSRIRVGMIDQSTTSWVSMPVTAPASSLFAIVTSPMPPTTQATGATWEALLVSGSLDTTCQLQGFSIGPGNGLRLRIGVLGDDNGDCHSPGSFIGLGASAGPTSGNVAPAMADHGARMTATFAFVMVK
ncbi:MAG TPA: fibrinogen-like YCDxxxxGGGW domain-containing protein, partial [Minicystis sp.]|nr:fibrinogen-like YCDxxxxGGGW domain-containing protein [Minicystis sp.]